jgi:hypothetical protein
MPPCTERLMSGAKPSSRQVSVLLSARDTVAALSASDKWSGAVTINSGQYQNSGSVESAVIWVGG